MLLFFDLPWWATGVNFLIGLFVFLVMAGGLFVALLVKSRTDISTLQTDRATAAEGLVKIRDAEIVKLNCDIDDLEKELEALTAEHRTLAGISIKQLMDFWVIKESIQAEILDLKQEIRILTLRKDRDA